MGGSESALSSPPKLPDSNLSDFGKLDKYWFSEPDAEKPIFYAKEGDASEKGFKAITVPQLLTRAAEKRGAKPALRVERPLVDLPHLPLDEKKRPKIPPALPLDQWQTWTYQEYLDDVRKAAKAMIALGLKPHESCNIFGFNSPEWSICQLAVIFAGGKAAGIYPTDTPEQVKFKSDHSNGSIMTVDSQKNFDKVKQVAAKLPLLKAIISWGDLASYSSLRNASNEEVKVLSWDDFLAYGDKMKISDAELEERIKNQRPGHCCVLIYTSGTTGQPKACMLSHDNLIFESYLVVVRNIDNFGTEEQQERYISYLPLSHVAGMMVDIISPLTCTAFLPAWATCHYARPYDMKTGTLVERMQAVQPTMFLGVPRVWEKMADKLSATVSELTGVKSKLTNWAMNEGLKYTESCNYGGTAHKSYSYLLADKLVLSKVKAKLGLGECKFCFTGAAPIQLETQRYLGKFGLNINEVYGMSEGTGGSCWSRDACHLWGTTGYPMPTTDLKIFKRDLQNINKKEIVPKAKDVFNAKEEEQGEICSRGRNIMMGYMANPRMGEEHVKDIEKKNRESIDNEGYLHSEDKGCYSETGFVKITGRYKELIIGAGGENIAPVPIEDSIKRTSKVVSNIIMIGDKRKFNIALVTLKLQNATGELPGTKFLEPSAFKHVNPDIETIDQALDCKKVIKEITDKITETNNDGDVCISNACKIQKFMVLPRDVSIVTGELTATLKLKRNVVEDKFKDIIDMIYASRETYVRFPSHKFDDFYKGH